MSPESIASIAYWVLLAVLITVFFAFSIWASWRLRREDAELFELRRDYMLRAADKLLEGTDGTCVNRHASRDPQRFRCSECGCDEKFGGWFRYCPECGRKVVRDGEQER